MATLVLTTVGTALFGPIGGAIGAILGQQVDAELFGPKGREGPRLNDLSVQTSTYGTPIPRVFGTMRIAGTVVWATDLKEDRTREGGGKGRPETTAYSYSASLAVALSGRPILAVRRIWADGKLLRGAGGDFKSETGYRLHLGGERQAVDPLLASAEGADGTPAYRGVALAVFEDFQLADYGNRIPSLTFEVEADVGAVPFERVVEELGEGLAAASGTATLTGYAAHGDSVRGSLDTLLKAMPHRLSDDGALLRFAESAPAALALDDDDLGAASGARGGPRAAFDRQSADVTPDEIALRYYEPERDYQAGLQRARLGGPGLRTERVDIPAAFTAPRAKAIAETRLDRAWAERARAKVTLPWRAIGLRPGAALRIPGHAGDWRIAGFSLEKMALGLDLVRIGGGVATEADSAAPGRSVGDPDLVHGPSVIHLLDLPALDDQLDAAPRLLVAAAGPSPGWRHASLALSVDGGASFSSLGETAPPAVIGVTTGVLAAGQAALIDDLASVEVELLHEGMWLEGRSDDALVGGANLALVGDELIQFGAAEPLGGNRFRLSRLLRGRRGTEWAMGLHTAGERFVRIDPAALRGFDLPAGAIGAALEVLASGVGDAEPAVAETLLAGRSIRPPAPVHLTARREADGGIGFAWTRRSRLGWAWTDGGDVPLGEEDELWAVTIVPDAGSPRTLETQSPSYFYGTDAQITDGAEAATSFLLEVAQIGALGRSEPPAARQFEL